MVTSVPAFALLAMLMIFAGCDKQNDFATDDSQLKQFEEELNSIVESQTAADAEVVGEQSDAEPSQPTKSGSEMSFVRVKGNQFVNEDGEPMIFKGLAICCPDKIESDGHWNREHFEVIKSWGANLIRIPIHPSALREKGMQNYIKLLDDAVAWCSELEMYVIIDWHSIGNLREGKFESNDYRTSLKETKTFWKIISHHFAGNPTVAFYEIFNEPNTGFGEFGECSWPQWKAIAEDIIDSIYTNDRNVIPLVAGFNWAYDLKGVKADPIDRPGIAYVAHIYAGKCEAPREPHWEEHFGFVTDRHPLIVTEMGYCLQGDYDYMIDNGSFRHTMMSYLDKKNISWCAWIFDPDWAPALIDSYSYRPTHSGKFFKNAMLKK